MLSLSDKYKIQMSALDQKYKDQLSDISYNWEVGNFGDQVMAVFQGSMSIPTSGISKDKIKIILNKIKENFPYVSDGFLSGGNLILMIEPDDIGEPSDFRNFLKKLQKAQSDSKAIRNIIASGHQDSLML